MVFLYRQWEVRQFSKRPFFYPNEHSRFLTVDGVRLHYIVFGMGPDLLLLHGLGANVFCWRLLIPILSRFYRVWAVDLKGFGCSDKPKDHFYGLRDQAQLVLKFIRALNVTQMAVVGNSMGGAIAAEMAITDPELIPKVVLINSAHDPKIIRRILWIDLRWLRNLLIGPVAPFVNKQTVKQVARLLYGKKFAVSAEMIEAYIAPYMKGLDAHWAFAQALDAIMEEGLVNRLQSCRAKILILWGEKDLLTPLKYGLSLHQGLKGSLFFSHPSGGHHLQEEEPQWIADHIIKFV